MNDPFISENTSYYEMDYLSSIDIDNSLDWDIAEFFKRKYIS